DYNVSAFPRGSKVYPMKIRDVKTYRLNAVLAEPFAYAQASISLRDAGVGAGIVRFVADSPLEGMRFEPLVPPSKTDGLLTVFAGEITPAQAVIGMENPDAGFQACGEAHHCWGPKTARLWTLGPSGARGTDARKV